MTDYHYAAEQAYNAARRCGGLFWMELPQARRDELADLARAFEATFTPPPDTWCPDCDEYKDEIRGLEDNAYDLQDRIEELEGQLQAIEEGNAA